MKERKNLKSLSIVFFCLLLCGLLNVREACAAETESVSMTEAEMKANAEAAFPAAEVARLKTQVNSKKARVYVDKKDTDTVAANGSTPVIYKKYSYPTRKGVILVTADFYKGIIPTGHSAIVYSDKKVVEALANGVKEGRNNWNTAKTDCSAVTPYDTTASQDKKAADWCYKKIGKPYNYNYFNVSTRKKFYCSQLVWAAFQDNFKVNLNTSFAGKAVHPLELANTSKTYFVYVK